MSKRTASRNVRRTGDVLCSSGSPSITEVEAAKLILLAESTKNSYFI